MALCRNVLQEDDILCELYADTRSDISYYSDNESLDSDSDVPTTSSHKQLQWRTQEFFSGGVQQIQLRTEVREDGDLGAVAP